MNSTASPPKSMLSPPSQQSNGVRQRLVKDMSISDLSGTPTGLAKQRRRRQRQLQQQDAATGEIAAAAKAIAKNAMPRPLLVHDRKLKDYFDAVQSDDDDESDEGCETLGATTQQTNTTTDRHSVDNSEETEPTANTTYARDTRLAMQSNIPPTAKIIDDIIRTLELNVQKKKKLEVVEKRKQKKKSKPVDGNQSDDSEAAHSSKERLASSLTQLEATETLVRKKKKTKPKERLSKSLNNIDTTKAISSSNNSPAHNQGKAQRLKDKLAGSLERIETLIDQRLAKRADAQAFRDSNDTESRSVSAERSEPRSRAVLEAQEKEDDEQTNRGMDRSSAKASSETIEKEKHGRNFPATPKRENLLTPLQDRTKRGVEQENKPKTPTTPKTPNTPATPNVDLPGIYKCYTVKTKGSCDASPNSHDTSSSSRSSESSSQPSPATLERLRQAHRRDFAQEKSGWRSSLTELLDDIHSLLSNNNNNNESGDEYSALSAPLMMETPERSTVRRTARRPKARLALHSSDNPDDPGVFSPLCWSGASSSSSFQSNSSPHCRQQRAWSGSPSFQSNSSPHCRPQARTAFWEEHRRSRLPINPTQRPKDTNTGDLAATPRTFSMEDRWPVDPIPIHRTPKVIVSPQTKTSCPDVVRSKLERKDSVKSKSKATNKAQMKKSNSVKLKREGVC